jgi:hypothetical protein
LVDTQKRFKNIVIDFRSKMIIKNIIISVNVIGEEFKEIFCINGCAFMEYISLRMKVNREKFIWIDNNYKHLESMLLVSMDVIL